jgi:virginiamycin B lyase
MAKYPALVSIVLAAGELARAGSYSNLTTYALAAGRHPVGITAGPDGALWFTEAGADGIGRITTDGTLREFHLPRPAGLPGTITVGPDGALWFTNASGVGRITTSGAVTAYPTPSLAVGITAGPDGALWFTEYYAGKIGRMTTDGVVTAEYDVPLSACTQVFTTPNQIAAGPDGALWFTSENCAIGRIATDGTIIVYDAPESTESEGIAAGPDGALWFAGGSGNQIGRVTTAGEFTMYRVPTPTSYPNAIAAGGDGALWFTELDTGRFGRITTAGVVTDYPSHAAGSQDGAYEGIAAGPDGALWIAGYRYNQIARAPACGLGFSAGFGTGTLTMNFNLGIDTPATFNILLENAAGDPIAEPFSKAIPALTPPRSFTMNWQVPSLGTVTVRPILTAGAGQAICSEWTSVDTSQ